MQSPNQRKMTTLTIFSFVVLVSLYGCGGGSGESDKSAVTPEAIDKPVEVTQLAINDLVAAPDFNFTSKSNIIVKLNVEQYQGRRSYINVYRHYQMMSDGSYYPDGASRVVSGPLVDGHFTQTFTGFNKQQQYLVEIWTYDNLPPQQQEITVTNDQLVWY